MCTVAAQAALAQRSDVAVAASCAALAVLITAAAGSPISAEDKATVLEILSPDALADLFCEADGAELQAVLSALHSSMGWSEQYAAALLLGLRLLQAQPTDSDFANTTAGTTRVAMALFRYTPHGIEAPSLTDRELVARAALLRTTGEHVHAVASMLRRVPEVRRAACLAGSINNLQSTSCHV